jgi:hypothetical protein
MQGMKKRKQGVHGTNASYGTPAYGDWPVKALPTLDPTLLLYRWTYGPSALVDERKLVSTLIEKGRDIRMPVLEWPCVAPSYTRDGIGFLGMHLSDDDVFVDSHSKRNMLVDRAHQYFNVDWKFEVQALCSNLNDGLDPFERARMQFRNYQFTEAYLYNVVNTIDLMWDTYKKLKPETVDLIKRSRTHTELRTSMLITIEEHDNYLL